MDSLSINSILEVIKNTKTKDLDDPIIVNSTILIDILSQLNTSIALKFRDQIFDNLDNLSPENAGHLLKIIRNSLGITQEKASELSGISQGNISLIENGSKKLVKGKVFCIGEKQKRKLINTYKKLTA